MLKKIKNLPPLPGVYQYFDRNSKLLYIGKAKNLQKRVKSYFRFTPSLHPNPKLSPRILKMLNQVVNLKYIVVENEEDALILENSLIKQLKPKYNILLRDDKTYPYIYIDLEDKFPRFEITRKIIKGKIKYFGPFVKGSKEIIETMYEILPLVQSKSCIKGKKSCIFHQLNKCLAPCEGKITPQEYLKIVEKGIDLLSNPNNMIEFLTSKMFKFAENLQFEEAQKQKEKIEIIKNLKFHSNVDLLNKENLDLFYIETNQQQAIIIKLFIREGKLISSDNSIINLQNIDIDEIYKRAILDFYSIGKPLTTNKILVGHPFEEKNILSKMLSKKFNTEIKIVTPTTKIRKKLIEICKLNATELSKQNKNKDKDIYEKLKYMFNLKNLPYNIEVFDTSHLQGENCVGSKIVWENDKFQKRKYRHYNLNATDEYSQMRELLLKRAQSFNKLSPPDLWLIDGGKIQISIAKEIIDSVGIEVDILGISKEKINNKTNRKKSSANDKIHSFENSYNLSTSSELLQFLQKLRDEAHRFAISFHRKQKIKQNMEIELLKINGIGKAKLKKLLNFFGTFDNIKNASYEELLSILDKKSAYNIYMKFNK